MKGKKSLSLSAPVPSDSIAGPPGFNLKEKK
nr:MAG TPA: hypothetical protein [Caudoviricetes sp.]